MRKIILRNSLSPGDLVVLSGALRDLHRCHPGEFATDVRTSCPAIFEHNPLVTPLDENDPGVTILECKYPLIARSNERTIHFLEAFIADLNEQLGTRVHPTAFRGDIHFSARERRWFDAVEAEVGRPGAFWLFASGGKFDCTTKWWDPARYQQVVREFAGALAFVQVGETHHHHPAIDGAIDLRGRTTLRQLIRLMHHADGAVSAISALMHLAAAVPARADLPEPRACVVIAGGREPPHWEAYPSHQFIHTVGALTCCATGGCWKKRTVPLFDGFDRPDEMCEQPVGVLPRCLDLIGADDVGRRIRLYYDGGALPVRTSTAALDLREHLLLLAGPPAAVLDGPSPERYLRAVRTLDRIDGTTELARLPDVDARVERTPPFVEIWFHGDMLRAPAHAAAALEYVASHPRFVPADLPGLSPPAQLTLVRRLVREGLVLPADRLRGLS
jgi:hypothetical protein